MLKLLNDAGAGTVPGAETEQAPWLAGARLSAAWARPRVLLATTNWSAGMLELASWLKTWSLAEAVVFRSGGVKAIPLREALAPGEKGLADGILPRSIHDELVKALSLPDQSASFRVLDEDHFEVIYASFGEPLLIGRIDGELYATACSEEQLKTLRAEASGALETLPGGPLNETSLRMVIGLLGSALTRKIAESQPHILGFALQPGRTQVVRAQISAARLITEAHVILGGPVCTLHPVEALTESGADFVFTGEAEETLAQFVHTIGARRRSTPLSSGDWAQLLQIGGLVFDYGKVHFNARQSRYQDPKVPTVSRAVLTGNAVDFSVLENFEQHQEDIFISSGRGCPGLCTFCTHIHGRAVRSRGAAELIAEIENLHRAVAAGRLFLQRAHVYRDVSDTVLQRKLGSWLSIMDDDFLVNRQRAHQFFELWSRSPLAEQYRINIQTNPVSLLLRTGPDEALMSAIDRFKVHLQLGAESFHPDLLRRFNKRHSPAQMEAAFARLETMGMVYTSNQILADFESTPEELAENLFLIIETTRRFPHMALSPVALTFPSSRSFLQRDLRQQGRINPLSIYDEYESKYYHLFRDPLVPLMALRLKNELETAALERAQWESCYSRAVSVMQSAVAQALEEEAFADTAHRCGDYRRLAQWIRQKSETLFA